MRRRVWIEQEVEVEITAEDAVVAILELDQPERLPMALRGISYCVRFLKHIPDVLIASMKDNQREIILAALEEQAERYRNAKNEI